MCECGIYICGKSVEVVKSNLEQHKKTEKHRNQFAAVKISNIKLHGTNYIKINQDGNYEIDQGVNWEGIEELKKQLAIINYEKNLEEEE